ncbi:MAG: sigma-70 family RNA polymerase sigma factor, partial [Firmicutes bacterium]|nr:sigma-70 family RNA polymerase sigma factor [Bacillota bacterium]
GDPAIDARVCESLTLSHALSALPEIQRTVIEMRFLEERTQADVARSLGISQPQVHRIEKAALVKLRHALGGE